MARAEKAFMVGSALGEADVLLQKKDGRAGRDGDGDGKLNEGKDGERLASPENIAMGTAAVGSIGGTVAGSRVGQRIVRAKVNRLLDRGIKRSMSGLEQMTQSLEMRLDDQPHLRGKAKVLERIGRVNARYGKKLIQAASKIRFRAAATGGVAGAAIGLPLAIAAYYGAKATSPRAEKAFMIGSALGEADGLIKAFDESKHRRDEDGKFTEKEGGAVSSETRSAASLAAAGVGFIGSRKVAAAVLRGQYFPGKNIALSLMGAAGGTLAAAVPMFSEDPVRQAAGLVGGVAGAAVGYRGATAAGAKYLTPASNRVAAAVKRHANLQARADRARGRPSVSDLTAAAHKRREPIREMYSKYKFGDAGHNSKIEVEVKKEKARLLREAVTPKDLSAERAKPFAYEKGPYVSRSSKLHDLTGSVGAKERVFGVGIVRGSSIAGTAAGMLGADAVRRKLEE